MLSTNSVITERKIELSFNLDLFGKCIAYLCMVKGTENTEGAKNDFHCYNNLVLLY